VHVTTNVKLVKENGSSQLTANVISVKQSCEINIFIVGISPITKFAQFSLVLPKD